MFENTGQPYRVMRDRNNIMRLQFLKIIEIYIKQTDGL